MPCEASSVLDQIMGITRGLLMQVVSLRWSSVSAAGNDVNDDTTPNLMFLDHSESDRIIPTCTDFGRSSVVGSPRKWKILFL